LLRGFFFVNTPRSFLSGRVVSPTVPILLPTPLSVGTALFVTEIAPKRLGGMVAALVLTMVAALPVPRGSVGEASGNPVADRKLMGLHVGKVLETMPTSERGWIRNHRVEVSWSDVETSRGVYKWTRLDELVNLVLSTGSESIMFLVGGPTPAWAQDPSYGVFAGSAPPKDLNWWYLFCSAVAERYGSLVLSFLSMAVGSLFFVVALTAGGGWSELAGYNLAGWAWLLYLGVVTVGLGYVLYFEGLRRVPASRGASLFYLKPVLALLVAHAALGEPVTYTLLLASLLVASGILLVTLPREKAQGH
jgi:uncharacterized membrane protein